MRLVQRVVLQTELSSASSAEHSSAASTQLIVMAVSDVGAGVVPVHRHADQLACFSAEGVPGGTSDEDDGKVGGSSDDDEAGKKIWPSDPQGALCPNIVQLVLIVI